MYNMKSEFNLPHRKFCKKDKRQVSFRLNDDLLKQLEKAAKRNGYTATEVLTTALDQFLQYEEKECEKNK